MGRGLRLDDVSCAICMDSLFNKRDDLDEVEPIATPDCGHVFHEQCLLEWFQTQTAAYIAAVRDQDSRESSPDPAEAPVECPTCRRECYANESTGEPTIHRLFINFGADCSSQVGSSPPRPSTSLTSISDKEIVALGRRAKSLNEEFKGLDAGSEEAHLGGAMRRLEGLKDDIVSSKALKGFETNVGGLNTAITALKRTLETHPLIHTLRGKIEEMKQKVKTTERDMRELASITLPQQIIAAVAKEKASTAFTMSQYENQLKVLQQQLGAEKMARNKARQAALELEQVQRLELETANKRAKELEEDVKDLQKQVEDRTKMLIQSRAKADSRKEIKAENEELRKTIDRLESQVALLKEGARQGIGSNPSPASIRDEVRGLNDVSQISLGSLDGDHAGSDPLRYDESLSIIMPPDLSLSLSSPPRAGPSRNPTARTIACELKPGKQPALSHRSKYFTNVHVVPDEADRSLVDLTEPQDYGGMNIPSSSSPSASPSLRKQKSTPCAVTRGESDKRQVLKPTKSGNMDTNIRPNANGSVIDLTGDSPKSLSPQPRTLLDSLTRRDKIVGASKRPASVVERLGWTDARGRPVKGLVAGARAKRRA